MSVRDEAYRRIAEARDRAAPVLDLGDLPLDLLQLDLRNLPALRMLALGQQYVRLEGDNLEMGLDLSRPNQRFTDLNVLRELPYLQHLDLCGWRHLTDVDGLRYVPCLKSLDLSRCSSLANANGFKYLRRLQSLELWDCASLTTVDVLKNLRFLDSLNLSQCSSLTSLDVLRDLPRLRSLNLAECSSLANVRVLNDLRCLKSLDLSGHKSLTNVDMLANLTLLDWLSLARCSSLVNVHGLKDLRRLRTLELCDCTSLTTVDGLKALRRLRSLNLSRCISLNNVNVLEYLRRVQRLDLSGCEFLTNVDALKHLRRLERLDLQRCSSLVDVDGLKELSRLQRLSLDWCKSLENLGVLKDLPRLRSLSLSYCSGLREFAPLHSLLPQLRRLSLYRCRFIDLDPMICGKLFTDNVLNAVRKFYADSEHGLRTDDEVKIFVLGNGGVGKTQLCRRLRNKGFLDNKRSTSGTHVHSISVALPGHAALVRLNLWDFGGQDIYLGTHHLFLHEQAIFVLMWTPETENGEHEEAGVRTPHRPLVFWLDYIRSLAGADNPVLLVQGKCDRDGDRHSRSVLQVDPNRTNRMINPLQIAQKGNTMSIDPTTTPKRTKLDEMLTHLDATKIVFEEFGYFVALSEDRETIFACPMNADGTPDRDTDEPHLNWIQVTAPEPEFVEKVNSVYGTSFDWKGFAGR